ncbi:MAG: hypothetical protein ACOC6N_02940 [archaeon]
MSGREIKKAGQNVSVYVLIGAIFALLVGAIGYVLVFIEDAMIPFGKVGKFVFIVIVLGVNGFLVIYVAQLKGVVKRTVKTSI